MKRSAVECVTAEIFATPGARKSHAAFVKQGTQVLLMLPVDTPREGRAKIAEVLSHLESVIGKAELR